MRHIRRWREAQFIYMPGAVAPSSPPHDNGADNNDPSDPETAEQVPLVLPSAVQPARRDAICLHRVSEYERQLRQAQLQDSLVELRRARRVRHSLLLNHRTQIAGQGTRPSTRSRTVISGTEDRIAKFAQRYRVAYGALLQLDPNGEWRKTYLELREEDNRGPGKEDHEKRLGDGSFTFSWIWLLNPRARDGSGSEEGDAESGATDEEVNDEMRVQWTTSHARLERWTEEVELLQEEMRRVVAFLEWKLEDWLGKQNARSTTTTASIKSGLQAYARKQAAVYHDLAVSFSNLWRPALVSHNLERSWVTHCMERWGILPDDADTPTARPQGVSQARVLSEQDGGSSTVTALRVPFQDSSDVTMADDPPLLEEVYYVEEDEDEDDGSVDWSIPGLSDSDDSGDYDTDGDFDFDFDFV